MSSFDFKKLYDVGEHLENYSKEEEYQRSSITRYYYFIYPRVKEYYEKSFRKILPSNNGHSTLINTLEKSPFEKEKILGEKLRFLRNNRNHADYHKQKLRKNKVKESKKRSNEILVILDYLIKHSVRLMN